MLVLLNFFYLPLESVYIFHIVVQVVLGQVIVLIEMTQRIRSVLLQMIFM